MPRPEIVTRFPPDHGGSSSFGAVSARMTSIVSSSAATALYCCIIGRVAGPARAIVVGLLALGLVSAARAESLRSAGSFCGTAFGAVWVAKVGVPGGRATVGGDDYYFWKKRVDCHWAEQKVTFLTHALGTKYMKFANLGDFKCRAIRPSNQHVFTVRPHGVQGECWNTRPNSVARFWWRPANLPPRQKRP